MTLYRAFTVPVCDQKSEGTPEIDYFKLRNNRTAFLWESKRMLLGNKNAFVRSPTRRRIDLFYAKPRINDTIF